MHKATYLDIDGCSVFVEMFGDPTSPVLHCVHTAGQSGVQYRKVAPQLAAKGYYVVVADLPGHGRSEPATNGPIVDLGEFAQISIDVLDQLGVDSFYLLGCSIGGRIVLDIALKVPDRVLGVVSMASPDGRLAHVGPFAPFGLEDASTPSMRDRTYYGQFAITSTKTPAHVREMIATMHCREDWHITVCDGEAMRRHDLWDELPSMKPPVIMVMGEADLSRYKGEKTAARIPGSRFVVLEGAGHYPMEEMSDFADVCSVWLEELQQRAGHAR